MCGRFALGVQANDLATATHRDYFAHAPPPASSPPSHTDHRDQEHDHQPQQQHTSSSTTTDHPVQWASLESQSAFRPRFNVAPTTKVPVLRRSQRDPATFEFDLLRWGLVPHWYATPPDAGLSTINAQCESVFEATPAWRGPRDSKRCVVVAQGFYEWLNKGKDKVPHFVKRKDGKLMAFAGLWDHCDYKGAYDPVTSYTILTVPVNKQLRFLHSRMPAILSSGAEIATWLSDSRWNDKLKTLVRPFEGELECYAVDKGVGKAGNESEDFVKPVAQKKGSLDSFFARQTASSGSGSGAGSGAKPKQASSSSSASSSSHKPPAPTSTSSSKPVKPKSSTSTSASASPLSSSTSRREPQGALEPLQEDERDAHDAASSVGDGVGAPKLEQDDEPAAFNADEDTPGRVGAVAAELSPAAADAGSSSSVRGAAASGDKGTKRSRSASGDGGGVDVIDIASDSSGDEGEGEVRAAKRAKKDPPAEQGGKQGEREGGEGGAADEKEKGKEKDKTKADDEGNEALTDFFAVVPQGEEQGKGGE
ncbi:uncharacterized protein RHOBADRAFT_55027 [Rhodotorula graminis WP1]|uniref:DUF159-domain-containing protein n=1 Tax=Rhodotorula graminis (strain WP1) TaxID=578459 RepID=A0A0P9FC53_RHOGW|nr:uncharacterized protein RHOBADRAFT_55027 [Rhodotorula graminis WP1]KPV73255.1 hypothetical protein RHOBADRAFT_55027 [Rhodotorula graminis WP1]